MCATLNHLMGGAGAIRGKLGALGSLILSTKGLVVAKFVIGVMLLGFGLAGCNNANPDATTTPPESASTTPIERAGGGNFHLYVSNQSFDIDPVEIQVYIDGQEVVNGTFRVESQHTWILFDLDLEPGEHTLRVTGHDGEAELIETFNISDEHWGLVEFWANQTEAPEPMFTFYVQDEPIGFA